MGIVWGLYRVQGLVRLRVWVLGFGSQGLVV